MEWQMGKQTNPAFSVAGEQPPGVGGQGGKALGIQVEQQPQVMGWAQQPEASFLISGPRSVSSPPTRLLDSQHLPHLNRP